MRSSDTTHQMLVIAHRGASGYLPEHTLAGKALAYGLGADFIEQDVVLTNDGHAVVLHDLYLDAVTDVAEKFSGRARTDGRHYAIDFSLAEIKTLCVHERVRLETGQPVFPGRFDSAQALFTVATLSEEIELIQGLNRSMHRDVGIYPEIKHPSWHRRQGYDPSQQVLRVLADYGYLDKRDTVFLQCFEPDELRRIRTQLGCRLPLVQLIEDGSPPDAAIDHDQLASDAGLAEIAAYADAIGPSLARILSGLGDDGSSATVKAAHRHGLAVHAYTFRVDALPEGVENPGRLFQLLKQAEVDGLFTDFPDEVRACDLNSPLGGRR